jgi:hypothetical protein
MSIPFNPVTRFSNCSGASEFWRNVITPAVNATVAISKVMTHSIYLQEMPLIITKELEFLVITHSIYLQEMPVNKNSEELELLLHGIIMRMIQSGGNDHANEMIRYVE